MSPRFRLVAHILGFVVVCWWIAIFFGELLICEPVDYLWTPQAKLTCGNENLMIVIAPIPWVVTDIAILIAPVSPIRKLQISTRKRIALYTIFLLGGM